MRTALTVSDKESADTSGDVSEPSEQHEVELPEIDSPASSDRESMDVETGPILSRTQRTGSNSRVEREKKKEDAVVPSPTRSDVSFDFGGSPHGSVDMNDDKNVTIRSRRSAKSTERKSKHTEPTTESSTERGFDNDAASPFSTNEGPVTPLSNGAFWHVGVELKCLPCWHYFEYT